MNILGPARAVEADTGDGNDHIVGQDFCCRHTDQPLQDLYRSSWELQ